MEQLTSLLYLKQLINQPTNFEPNKNPTCIDLIFIGLPKTNLGHHKMTFYRTNFHILPPPSFERKIWQINRANIRLIRQAISQFPWPVHLNTNLLRIGKLKHSRNSSEYYVYFYSQ